MFPVPFLKSGAALFRHLIVLQALCCFYVALGANYTLDTLLKGDAFFEAFNFETIDDPTHGTVDYVDQATAEAAGMLNVTSLTGAVRFGADASSVVAADARGRKSVRLHSKATYADGGLFVLDLAHMPGGCGQWPAFWLLGPEPWPENGEVDIIEQVDLATQTLTTLHTTEGCSMDGTNSSMTGSWAAGDDASTEATDCYIDAPGQWENQGCQIVADSPVSFGQALNGAGGGVYALEWVADDHFAAWFWSARDGGAPADVKARDPDVASWGEPYAHFALGDNCPGAQHFADLALIFDLTFCGDWSGYDQPYGCADEIAANGWPATCDSFVRDYPAEFSDAYWLVNELAVYSPTTLGRQ